MSETSDREVRRPADARLVPEAATDEGEPWPTGEPAADPGGMTRFAGLVLGLVGIWHAVAGLVALIDPTQFLTTTAALPLHVGYTTWGWTHLVIGVLALFAGFGVLSGNRLAAVVAVVLTVISAVVNLVFMKAEPFWSVMVIALDILVIWGVTAQAPRPKPTS
jgi:hypothetical protein